MTKAQSHAREHLRHYAILLTLGFWSFHFLFSLLRGLWLPVPIEAVLGRQEVVTLTGLFLCALQYSLLEGASARRFPVLAASMVAGAFCAALINTAAPIAVHAIEVGGWHRDADPIAFLSVTAYWLWVFLAWSSLNVALDFAFMTASESRPGPDEPVAERLGDLWLPYRGRLARVALEAIDHIEAAGDYVVIHADGREYLAKQSLRALEQSLDQAAFARVHRRAIVRLGAISRIERGPNGLSRIELHNGDIVPVSRNRRRALAERLGAG